MRGGCACLGAAGTLYTSAHFCCEPKAAVKNKSDRGRNMSCVLSIDHVEARV